MLKKAESPRCYKENYAQLTFLAFKQPDVVFIMLINAKMPIIVGILTFMSMIKFKVSSVEHEKGFITSGPDRTSVCFHLGCYIPVYTWPLS